MRKLVLPKSPKHQIKTAACQRMAVPPTPGPPYTTKAFYEKICAIQYFGFSFFISASSLAVGFLAYEPLCFRPTSYTYKTSKVCHSI